MQLKEIDFGRKVLERFQKIKQNRSKYKYGRFIVE